ncbi:MAG: hypothetical protein GY944_08390 [bacterium]|nr:hypothetical protein [bacterium]
MMNFRRLVNAAVLMALLGVSLSCGSSSGTSFLPDQVRAQAAAISLLLE